MSNIIRVGKRDHYTAFENATLRDKNLSWGARGMLTFLLSFPDNWQVRVSHLIEQSPNAKRDAVYSLLKELIAHGYMRRTAIKDKKGRITGYETLVFEMPDNPPEGYEFVAETGDEPFTDEPEAAEPDTDSPHTTNKLKEESPTKKERLIGHATQFPSNFTITTEMASWAKATTPLVDLKGETDNFRDYHVARGNTFKDWIAAWRTWMRNAVKFSNNRRATQAEMNRGGTGELVL